VSLPLHRPFKSVLVANRGEIAVRIVQEAEIAGIRSIAVYSDADKNALHVQEADTAVHIGPSPARESYLNAEKIILAAKLTGAEAIHPGYGFLSENAEFAEATIHAGLVWIGPSPAAIRAMGDKGAAKQIARNAQVPVIPGYDGDDQADAHLRTEAKKLGWPVLIKAANGGGGRGQRLVTSEGEFADALASARRESRSAFDSEKVILERALNNVRHVEVQVFGDMQGNVIHLGERDCSIQRRNQKIVEEAPAPGVSEQLRARMGEAAVRLSRAVNYTNAGTVEFLLDREDKFYFLEMNTRIQVEHPVTEKVTDKNLIAMQFEVAMGKSLDSQVWSEKFSANRVYGRPVVDQEPPSTVVQFPTAQPDSTILQQQVDLQGHAIEVRLCAEDPADNFAPQSGHIEEIYSYGGVRADGINFDGGPASGHYDSLLVKLISDGATREEARCKLINGLEKTRVVGIRTNRNFLIDLLKRDAVVSGAVDIGWLGREPPFADNNLESPMADIAALFLAAGGQSWHSTGTSRVIIVLRERSRTRALTVENSSIAGQRIEVRTSQRWNNVIPLEITNGGVLETAWVYRNGNRVHVHYKGRDALFEDITYAPAEPKDAAGDGAVRAPMAGKIVRVNAEPGAKVEKGQVLIILEAMKMEHEIVARTAGTVAAVTAKVGDQVANRQVLATISAP
jgi:geranyl-CoA carboxylase alpha subunit